MVRGRGDRIGEVLYLCKRPKPAGAILTIILCIMYYHPFGETVSNGTSIIIGKDV